MTSDRHAEHEQARQEEIPTLRPRLGFARRADFRRRIEAFQTLP